MYCVAEVEQDNMHEVAAHASYSSISSYQQCGEKYRLTKIKGFAELPAWWSAGGSAVHAATEWWDIGAHQELDTAGLFNQAFIEQIQREEKFSLTKRSEWRSSRGQDYDWWVDNGPGLVQTYIDWRQETQWSVFIFDHEGEDMVGVELPVNVDLGGMPVKGYIDRLFVTPAGEMVILDIKTGARKPDSPLQLGFYKAAIEVQYGLNADLGAYFMNKKKKGEQLIVEGLAQYTPQFVARFVSGFKKAREENLYLPHVTSFCKACGVARHCWAVNPDLEVSD